MSLRRAHGLSSERNLNSGFRDLFAILKHSATGKLKLVSPLRLKGFGGCAARFLIVPPFFLSPDDVKPIALGLGPDVASDPAILGVWLHTPLWQQHAQRLKLGLQLAIPRLSEA